MHASIFSPLFPNPSSGASPIRSFSRVRWRDTRQSCIWLLTLARRRHRDRIFRTNVLGTRVVAEAAGASTLHVSSVAAVGYSESGVPIDETAPNNFVPLRLVYHESKRLAEDEALAVTGRSACHYRTLYGPRELFHKFGHTMLELSKGKIPGHPSGGIFVTDVDDAAAGIVSALTLGENGERYLLVSSRRTQPYVRRHTPTSSAGDRPVL